MIANATQTVFTLSPEAVETITKHVLPVVTKGDFGSILETIHFDQRGGKLHVVGTDGSRLVEYESDAAGDNKNENFKVTVHRDHWQRFIKETTAKQRKSTGWLVKVLDNTIVITNCNDVSIEGAKTGGEYPRYQELFPVEFATEFYLVWSKPGAELKSGYNHTYERKLSEVDKLVMHAENIARADKECKLITLNLIETAGEGQLDVSMRSTCKYFSYAASVNIKGGFTGRVDQRVSFCADYLIDAIDHKSLVKVQMQLPLKDQNLKPVVFTYPADAKGVRHLLMPVQTK